VPAQREKALPQINYAFEIFLLPHINSLHYHLLFVACDASTVGASSP